MTARAEVHERLGHLLSTAAINLERPISGGEEEMAFVMAIAASCVRDALDIIDRHFAAEAGQ